MKRAVPQVRILGAPISAINMAGALLWITDQIRHRASGAVCLADVHSVMRARTDPLHARALASADLVTPDGKPLVWIGRLRGLRQISQVCGDDLLSAVCAESAKRGWRNYFYGGAEGVCDRLAEGLQRRHPGLVVAGADAPPFRPLTPSENEAALQIIRDTRPDIVWVGLGCPKQERWIAEHTERLPGMTLIGVGAAFNFHAGDVKRAPRWMRNSGLEWLHRLASEPRRLWRRYLQLAPAFMVLALLEFILRPRRDAVTNP
jgi:N-acetylglucosaminyldiphosphoundecaprenol N-acetyl-beta-D-mannosaminyltransferase